MKKCSLIFLVSLLSIGLALPTDAISRGAGYGGSRGYSGYKSYKSSYDKSYKGSSLKSYTHNRSENVNSASFGKTSQSSASYSKPIFIHPSVVRDSEGRIERSSSAKQDFLKSRGLKNVPKGYEVDHIVPLYAGGRDDPSNMQLMTTQQHDAKTRADYQKYER